MYLPVYIHIAINASAVPNDQIIKANTQDVCNLNKRCRGDVVGFLKLSDGRWGHAHSLGKNGKCDTLLFTYFFYSKCGHSILDFSQIYEN